MRLNYIAFSVSSLGFIFSVFVIFLNLRLLIKFSFTSLRKLHEYELFTIRFAVDILYSISVSFYYCGLCVSYIQNFVLLEFKPMFITTLLSSNVNTSRYLLSFFIATERLAAVFFPIKFHVHRQRIASLLLLMFILFYGLFEDVMYFLICKVEPFEKSCSIFGCTWNSCFLNYWTGNKMIIGGFSSAVSLVLFIKILSLKRVLLSSNLTKTNYLCLIDCFLTIVFDFCPFFATLVFKNNLLSADIFGPYNATIKSLACFIDAAVATYMLNPKRTPIVSNVKKASRISGIVTSGATRTL